MTLFGIGRRSGDDGGTGGDGHDRALRVFVTGATGYIGRGVVRELADAGHEVAGLTRWAEQTLALKRVGARAVVGDVRDPATYYRVAAEYDALVHLAAGGATVEEKATTDRAAIDALLHVAGRDVEEREKKGRPPRVVIYTSGCFVLGETRGEKPADEDSPTDHPPGIVAWRPDHERRILDAARPGIATAIIRPGMVYGGRGGVIGRFFRTAVEDGRAAYVGDGANRWSPVYRGDVARLYRMVAERAARGIFHCAEPRAVPVAELARSAAEAAGRDGATRSIPLDRARERMGGLADALVMDQAMAARRSHALGWRHEHPPFVESAVDVFREWEEGEPLA
ncbi:MAG: NAD-dependent epimerase/dehydratase family protein [Gemmatimonadota bacterium]